jgi:hypothetical protein
VRYYEAEFHRLIKSEGTVETNKKFKTYYQIALDYASGMKFEPLPFTASGKDGLPRLLWPFRRLLRSCNPNHKRAALSVLQLYKLSEKKGTYSLREIIREYKGQENPAWLAEFDRTIEREINPNLVRERINQLKPGLHISTKNGPNGPAILNAAIDREAIRGTSIESAIVKLSNLTNNRDLNMMLSWTETPPDKVPESKSRELCHSRLRVKTETGGKARIFAIVDYFSQCALKPIHQYIFGLLRKMPQDGTFSHGEAANTVRSWSDGRYRRNLWSFDLTSATDRFPFFLQKRVVVALFGQEIADCWEIIMRDREFVTPMEDCKVRYSVGQPMGALSSWAVFALTHHIFIRAAASYINLRRPLYRIIGDDICIARDQALADQYSSMMDDINLSLNRGKKGAEKSMMGYGQFVSELAKRRFVNGIELTPVPPDAIIEGWNDKSQLLLQASDRGYTLASQVYPVQSFMTSSHEWARLTFPFGRTSTPVKELRCFINSHWEDRDEKPPGGLDPNWNIWEQTPDDILFGSLQALLLVRASKAIIEFDKATQGLLDIANGYKVIDYQGGDWQPEPWVTHPRLLAQVVFYLIRTSTDSIEKLAQKTKTRSVSEVYAFQNAFQESPRSLYGEVVDYLDETCPLADSVQSQEETPTGVVSEISDFQPDSLNQLLASFKEILGPKPIFFRRDFRDEKAQTRVYASDLIRQIMKISKSDKPHEVLMKLARKGRKLQRKLMCYQAVTE